jgi:peptidyl-prolyl cis-trans isomerase B (cyclophilin B)
MKRKIIGVGLILSAMVVTFACKNGGEKKEEIKTEDSTQTEESAQVGEKTYPELEQEIDYNTDKTKDYLITIKTEYGDIQLVLYDETINHKKNFVKLATLGFYDSTAFHRVINEFMIQGGDPNSKAEASSTWGMGGPGYTVPAEFNPKFIHKKGALAAARTGGPSNPEKESSGSQFYIVHGKKYTDEELTQLEQSRTMHINQALNQVLNKPENLEVLQKAVQLQSTGNVAELEALLSKYKPEAQKLVDASKLTFTAEQRKIYKEIGGAAFLDMDYTVYGEVVKGLEVVDKIASLPVGGSQNSLPSKKVIVDVNVELLPKKEITKLTTYQY